MRVNHMEIAQNQEGKIRKKFRKFTISYDYNKFKKKFSSYLEHELHLHTNNWSH